jgi:hypothetical protein
VLFLILSSCLPPSRAALTSRAYVTSLSAVWATAPLVLPLLGLPARIGIAPLCQVGVSTLGSRFGARCQPATQIVVLALEA